MTKVYCYDRCSTCKKALAWLDAKGIEYQKIDIKGDNPDEVTLRVLQKKSGLPLKKFFNTSGMLYREMELSAKLPAMSKDEKFKLLVSDASFACEQTKLGSERSERRMLVKRPLLVTDDAVCTGFKEAEWKTSLNV